MDMSNQNLTIETKKEFEQSLKQNYQFAKEEEIRLKNDFDYQINKLKLMLKKLQKEKKEIEKVPSFKKYCLKHTWEERVKYCRDLAKRDGFKSFIENEDSLKVI